MTETSLTTLSDFVQIKDEEVYTTSRIVAEKFGKEHHNVIKAIEELRNETNVGVYSATTVGEETTGRGAFFVPTIVKPDFAIIVDVTYAVDVYGKKELAGDVKSPVTGKSKVKLIKKNNKRIATNL